MSRWLNRWQDAGAKRLMDFRELTAAIGRRLSLEERDGELLLRGEFDKQLFPVHAVAFGRS